VIDINQTVLQRFELKSRVLLIDEQSNSRKLLQPPSQYDSTSRWQTKKSLSTLLFYYTVIPDVTYPIIGNLTIKIFQFTKAVFQP
jgi:hypothetical protein